MLVAFPAYNLFSCELVDFFRALFYIRLAAKMLNLKLSFWNSFLKNKYF